jgi:hypothetical protein
LEDEDIIGLMDGVLLRSDDDDDDDDDMKYV